MKLPSGREISNEVLADIIDYVVLEAMSEESFSDAWNSLPSDLVCGGWGASGEEDYDDADALAIAREIRETAGEVWLKLTEKYGELHAQIIHKKYPHEG